jgi:hypothetical protein
MGDATAKIQSAIDTVSSMPMNQTTGFRGAVLIRAGFYEVSSPIFIRASGVVIRGQGSGSLGGTIIKYTSTNNKTDLFTFGSNSGDMTQDSSSVVNVVANPIVPVGTRVLNVTDASRFAVGDRIIIELQPNQDWIDQLSNMGQYGWYVLGVYNLVMLFNILSLKEKGLCLQGTQ